MSSNLQQLQISYDKIQDRLVIIFVTADFYEYRFWVTRHMTRALWDIFMKLKAELGKDIRHTQEERQQVSSQIQKEAQQPQAQKYATKIRQSPFGDAPLLIYKISAKPFENGSVVFHLEDIEMRSIEFFGDSRIIEVFIQMIDRSVSQTDWNLDLSIPSS